MTCVINNQSVTFFSRNDKIMKLLIIILLVILLNPLSNICNDERQKRSYIIFPETSYMELIWTLSIPLSQEHKDVMGSVFAATTYYFETKPTDIDKIAIEGRKKESQGGGITRRMVYHTIISNFEKFDLPGVECLYRLVCEVSSIDFHLNGLIGELISIIFQPSTSEYEDFHNLNGVVTAEELGKTGNCTKFIEKCTFDLLSEISYFL